MHAMCHVAVFLDFDGYELQMIGLAWPPPVRIIEF